MTRKAMFIALVLLVGMAAAQNYLLPWNSINSGGAPVSTSNFVLNSSVAQPVQGIGISANYEGYWGFWYGIGRVRRHDAGVTAITEPGDTVYMAAFTPEVTVEEFADALNDTTAVHFAILDSVATMVYHESTTVILDSADVVYPTFPDYTPTVPGNYQAVAWTVNRYDGTRSNDTTDKAFYVSETPPETGWVRKADMPLGAKSKKVKDGGALAYAESEDTLDAPRGFIYAFKGNGRYEFYRYNTISNAWVTKESIPAIGRAGKKKPVKKGSALTSDTDYEKVYGFKGNNSIEFWRYFQDTGAAYPWQQLADVPLGAKTLREGTGAVSLTLGDSSYLYLLKGSGTQEFYRYNIADNVWTSKAPALLGTSGKAYKNGSGLCYNEDAKTIYAVKGSYNEFFAYSVDSDRWTQKASVPLVGRSGKKKKLKDGAGMAYHDGIVYLSKGGNTVEFWKYYADSDKWAQMPDVPFGSGRNVKGGGAMTYAPKPGPGVYVLKGNNTNDLFRYGFGAMTNAQAPMTNAGAQGGTDRGLQFALRIAPNPFTTTTTIGYSLPHAGNVSLKLYDITGKLVTTYAKGYRNAGRFAFSVQRSELAAGIYILKLTTEDKATTTKLIVE